MNIMLNGDACEAEGKTLADILEQYGFQDSIVATAVNGIFVPKNNRDDHSIHAGDKIEIIAPMQGG